MKVLGWFSIVLISCTMLCGLWMKFGPGEKDANFHAMLSIGTILVCLITIILYMFKIK
jgi:Mg2+ and Co2+ transporter CorA